MKSEQTYEQNFKANKTTENLIESGANDFEVQIAVELHDLIERIKQKKSVSTIAARNIVFRLVTNYLYAEEPKMMGIREIFKT